MNIYEYNSSTVNEYSEEDFGVLTTSSLEIEDCGNLSNDLSDIKNYYTITCNETLIPFGSLKVSGSKTKYIRKTILFKKYIDLNSKSIILQGIILRWIGFSIIFQFCNDLERKVIPDVSGGGQS
jgi:hypothetical protein